MKKIAINVLTISTVLFGLFSCGQKELSEYPGYSKMEDGLYVKFLEENKEARAAESGDILTFSMTYKNSNDSVLLNTYETGVPIKLRADSGTYTGDIMKAFISMREGDSASIIVNADSFFLKTAGAKELPPFIDSASMLTFTAKLDAVQTMEEMQAAEATKNQSLQAEEVVLRQKYIEENGITQTPTESGLVIIPTKVGTGKKAEVGKKVRVAYAGKLLDGRYFDTSIEEIAKESGLYNAQRPYEPYAFTLGNREVIQGWDEAVATMKEGGKATLVIPSSLAYGDRSFPGSIITPYATLVFDIELVEVID